MGKITIGLDVGDRFSQICAVDQEGAVVREERVPTTRGALRERFPATVACRVIVEAGTHAGWISRELAALGHEVIVANSRKLRWLYHNEHKTDRVDATYLARVGRWDPTLLAPIRVRSASADGALRLLRARASLVRARTRLINHVRGAVKSVGCQLPPCDATSFARRVATHLPAELHLALQPLLGQVAGLTQTIARYDRQVEHVAAHAYPHTARLRQVTGVGALTALAFVLTVDDPQRFVNGRAVGAYFGLCPRRADSGGAAAATWYYEVWRRPGAPALGASRALHLGPVWPRLPPASLGPRAGPPRGQER